MIQPSGSLPGLLGRSGIKKIKNALIKRYTMGCLLSQELNLKLGYPLSLVNPVPTSRSAAIVTKVRILWQKSLGSFPKGLFHPLCKSRCVWWRLLPSTQILSLLLGYTILPHLLVSLAAGVAMWLNSNSGTRLDAMSSLYDSQRASSICSFSFCQMDPVCDDPDSTTQTRSLYGVAEPPDERSLSSWTSSGGIHLPTWNTAP